MSMELRISTEPNLLCVEATGRFSLAEAKRTFAEMLEAVVRTKVDKVIFDGRTLKGKPQFIERFYYGEFVARRYVEAVVRGACPVTKFAYLLKVPVRDPGRFGETVAANRGLRVQTFEDMDKALEWLGTGPQPGSERQQPPDLLS